MFSGLQGDAGGEVLAETQDQLPPLKVAKDVDMQGSESDSDSDNGGSEMEIDEVQRDFIDDPDERITNPTLYLRKFWRMVSPQSPVYHCYRDAAKRSYSCNLTLALPPGRTQTVKAPAAYPSKRAAKRAVSEFAIANGILDKAKQSMAVMDRLGTDREPAFRSRPLPKRDERFNSSTGELSRQEEQTHSSSQNPVTALNLAVQRYCIETPAQALLYAHESAQSTTANYRLHGCTLTVRVTPELHEQYRTDISFTSAKVAKEAATRLALQDGVVTLLKLHNSFTSKIHRQLGLPIPPSVDDHDPVDEENTATSLALLVQEIRRDPQAMLCEYTTSDPNGTELHGAILSVSLGPGDTKTYTMLPSTKSKKDAKEAVCRLAVKSGLAAQLQSQRRIIVASAAAMDKLGPKSSGNTAKGPPKAGAVNPEDADYLENAVAYLNLSMQAFTGKSDTLSFDFTELGPSYSIGRSMGARFGCVLTIHIRPQLVRKYMVEPDFPTKKAAKESVSKLAVKEGVVELAKEAKNSFRPTSLPSKPANHHLGGTDLDYQHVRATAGGYPSLHRDDTSTQMELLGHPEHPYATRANERPIAITLATQPVHEIYAVSPPPYSSGPSATSVGATPAQPAPAINPLIARHEYLAPAAASAPASSQEKSRSALNTSQGHALSAPQSAAEQIFVNLLEERAASKIGTAYRSHISYDIEKDATTGKYGGIFTLQIAPHNQHKFYVSPTYASSRIAREAVAFKAVHEGVLALIDRQWGMPGTPRVATEDGTPASMPDADKKSKDGQDPHSQPVSYLHQVCQVLLGSDAADRPRYELLRKEQSTLYGAILTINTEPVCIYKTDLTFVGKAAAKDAVSRMALQDNKLEKIKDEMIRRLAPNAAVERKRKERETAVDAFAASPSNATVSAWENSPALPQTMPQAKASYLEELQEYCKATLRPSPDWRTTTVASTVDSSQTVETSVSVKIADETFELDESRRGGDNVKEKLAKMVLKHLRKKDGAPSGGTKTVLLGE